MLMVTESLPLNRRAWCQRLGGSALTLLAGGAWANTGAARRSPAHPVTQGQLASSALFAACWDDVQGAHHAGWLQLGQAATGGTVSVLRSTELPTRGHGLALLPDGALLVLARRPGDWLLRLAQDKKPQWLWQESDRVFSGHVQVAADGRTVYTTEIDTDSGEGFLGVRDATSLAKRTEHATKGRDPHAVIVLPAIFSEANVQPLPGRHCSFPAGMLWVANGGIDTQAETGRVKRHLQQMDSSIVGLHPATGELLGLWRLPDTRLSLRHLAWAVPEGSTPGLASPCGPTLGIALQAEHDDPLQKAAAPLLAVLSWANQPDGVLHLAQGQPALAGYGGDITVSGEANNEHFVVSATRGNCLALFSQNGQFLGQRDLTEAGALAGESSEVWAGGRGGIATAALSAQADVFANCTVRPWTAGRLDNHWLRV